MSSIPDSFEETNKVCKEPNILPLPATDSQNAGIKHIITNFRQAKCDTPRITKATRLEQPDAGRGFMQPLYNPARNCCCDLYYRESSANYLGKKERLSNILLSLSFWNMGAEGLEPSRPLQSADFHPPTAFAVALGPGKPKQAVSKALRIGPSLYPRT